MDSPLQPYLDADAAALEARWERLVGWIQARFGKAPDLEAILFLVGVQSRGRGFEPDLDRDVKEALVMEGTYRVFATLGIYEQVGMEADGSWIWERVVDAPSGLSIKEQENLLKTAILRYFDDILDETPPVE